MSRPKASQVYFMRQGREGPIKIGISRNPEARRRDLQVANAEEIVLLATTPGGRTAEQDLHARFRKARIRGEWFKPTDAIPDHIAELLGQTRRTELFCRTITWMPTRPTIETDAPLLRNPGVMDMALDLGDVADGDQVELIDLLSVGVRAMERDYRDPPPDDAPDEEYECWVANGGIGDFPIDTLHALERLVDAVVNQVGPDDDAVRELVARAHSSGRRGVIYFGGWV